MDEAEKAFNACREAILPLNPVDHGSVVINLLASFIKTVPLARRNEAWRQLRLGAERCIETQPAIH